MEDQYERKSLTAIWPTKLVPSEWRGVVAEHKASHIRFMDRRLSLSTPLQLYQEVRNFAQRKFGRKFYAKHFTLRFTGPSRAGPFSPPLFLFYSFTLCMRTFTGCGDARNKLFP